MPAAVETFMAAGEESHPMAAEAVLTHDTARAAAVVRVHSPRRRPRRSGVEGSIMSEEEEGEMARTGMNLSKFPLAGPRLKAEAAAIQAHGQEDPAGDFGLVEGEEEQEGGEEHGLRPSCRAPARRPRSDIARTTRSTCCRRCSPLGGVEWS